MKVTALDLEDDDEDEWSEAFDAQVGRVDLVGAAANGSSFLLMKSAQDGLITPEAVRSLLAKSQPQNGSTTMAPRKMFRYASGWVTSPKALTNSQVATAFTKAKAKAAPQVAVFDAQGNLVGTVDADAIVPIAAPPQSADPDAPPADTTPAPSAAVGTPADQVAETVAKSMSGATFNTAAGSFTKAAGGSVSDRFEALVKSLDSLHSERLRSAVVLSSLQMMGRGAKSSAAAIDAAKRVALDVGTAAARSSVR